MDQNTGEVELFFNAEFKFNAGKLYRVRIKSNVLFDKA